MNGAFSERVYALMQTCNVRIIAATGLGVVIGLVTGANFPHINSK